jgi:hypothetical protein
MPINSSCSSGDRRSAASTTSRNGSTWVIFSPNVTFQSLLFYTMSRGRFPSRMPQRRRLALAVDRVGPGRRAWTMTRRCDGSRTSPFPCGQRPGRPRSQVRPSGTSWSGKSFWLLPNRIVPGALQGSGSAETTLT